MDRIILLIIIFIILNQVISSLKGKDTRTHHHPHAPVPPSRPRKALKPDFPQTLSDMVEVLRELKTDAHQRPQVLQHHSVAHRQRAPHKDLKSRRPLQKESYKRRVPLHKELQEKRPLVEPIYTEKKKFTKALILDRRQTLSFPEIRAST